MSKILLIDDDIKLADLLTQYFKQFDIHVTAKHHPSEGIKAVASQQYQALILDIMLPDMDGFEVCKKIRETSNIPIIMLTARGETTDKVVGLEIGADDYLAKPFEPRELVARVKNLMKRPSSQPQQISKNITLNTARQEVYLKDKVITLTTKEYALLNLFINHPDRVFSRDDILNELQGIDAQYFSRSVDITISRLRSKLKPEEPIQTVWGRGYRYNGITL